MTVDAWKAELFNLYKCCRDRTNEWPMNLERAIAWQDDDAANYLRELFELDKKGAFK